MIARAVAIGLLVLSMGCVASPQLVVATWNIHHGAGLDGQIDVDRLAAVLRDSGADLIALQEVDVGVTRSRGLDLPTELATRLGMHAVFSRNIDFQGGEYGNAILSRWPIDAWDNLHYTMLREGEQRGLLTAQIITPLGPVAFIATHIDYRPDDSERLANLTEIEARAARSDPGTAVILCGDFNDLPGSRVHRTLCTRFTDLWEQAGEGDGFTFPADLPIRRIDWILLRRDSPFSARRADVPATRASDHRPLVYLLTNRPGRFVKGSRGESAGLGR